MIHLLVTIDVRPERLDSFLRLLAGHREQSLREHGCVRFQPLSDGHRFVLDEAWESEDALALHRSTAHYAHWKAAMLDLEASPRQRQQLEPVPNVWVNGCFDGRALHVGHLTLLAEAARLGGTVTVALNSDAGVKQLKGEGRPLAAAWRRMARLHALPGVHRVVTFDTESELEDMLRQAQPDVLVKGSDWQDKPITGAEHCGRILFVQRVDGVSTTELG